MNDVFAICIEKFFHHIFHKFYQFAKTQSFAFAIELLKHWVTLWIATIGITKKMLKYERITMQHLIHIWFISDYDFCKLKCGCCWCMLCVIDDRRILCVWKLMEHISYFIDDTHKQNTGNRMPLGAIFFPFMFVWIVCLEHKNVWFYDLCVYALQYLLRIKKNKIQNIK